MGNEDDLQRCTVRLNVASSQGTGFFVAPNWILTCAHVVESAKDNPVEVFWKAGNQNYTAKVTQLCKYPLDLALLQLYEDCLDHPCVELDDTKPNTNDDLYIFGYPKNSEVDYSQGDSASFKYEGISFKQDIILYKLKQGQVISGFSGSPLLNLLTGKVCGIVHLSRDEGNDLGGRAVSAQVIVQQFPEIARLNQQFHQPKSKGDNPFEYGSPVSPQRFYGRRREILEIKNRIGAISPQCVNLVGLRRNGKTSLLRYIKERISEFCLPEQKPLVVFLDLTNGNFRTPEGIIEGLRRGIHKLTGNSPWLKEDNKDGFAVEDGLQDLVDEGYRLIILLDEFEAIASKKDRLELFQDWGGDWRSKACAGLLTMVIASKRPLNEVYKTLGMDSPFDNIFSTTISPVLEHWQNVIELEQNEQSKLSQGELINPFQYGNPVRLDQKNLFKGRQKFADEVVRRVLDRDRPTLVLHGPRRCGKTSFLYNFPRLLPSDILPVFVDMQSSAITTSESDFCFGLVRAIHKDCKSQGVQLPNIPKRTDFQPSPYTTLEDWLNEALAKIGERRILLNLDEFEKIGTAIRNGQITLRLFDELRHLIQHYEQLGFLFSGVQTLEELGPSWSSYFISVVPIEMLYLESNEAEELLLNPDPAFKLRYAPGVVEEVLRFTNCHPYCLQLLGASMVNQANFNYTDFITAELLQASINDAFISGQPYFTNIWTEFTGTTPEEMVIGQELLLQVAKTDILLPITTEIAEKVLTRLLRYHILHKINGGYDFEIPLLKQWVRERAVRS